MLSSWKPLRRFHLTPGTTIDAPDEEAARQVTLDSPAIEVMTDLERVRPVTANPDESLVAAEERDGRVSIRGIFSATQIARQLGMEIAIDPRAQTFAEIESELR